MRNLGHMVFLEKWCQALQLDFIHHNKIVVFPNLTARPLMTISESLTALPVECTWIELIKVSKTGHIPDNPTQEI